MIDVPKQNTPVMDNEAPALMSKPWWIALKGMVAALLNLGSSLSTVGAIPKVTGPGTLGESTAVDDGTEFYILGRTFGVGVIAPVSVVAGRRYITIKGDTAAGAFEVTGGAADADATLVGLVQCSDANGVGAEKRLAVIQVLTQGATANNRGGKMRFGTKADGGGVSFWETLDNAGLHGFGGNAAAAYPVDVTGDANVSGFYRVAGTQVVTSRQAAVTAPSISTSNTASTAGATYTATEQGMLNALKTAVTNLNTDVVNLQTAVNDLRSRLSTHGLIS